MKKTPRAVSARPRRTVHTEEVIPSIEERVAAARKALTLIIACANGAKGDDDVVDAQDVIVAIAELAADAHEELYWIQQVPGGVLNTEAPDDDQRADVAVTDERGA